MGLFGTAAPALWVWTVDSDVTVNQTSTVAYRFIDSMTEKQFMIEFFTYTVYSVNTLKYVKVFVFVRILLQLWFQIWHHPVLSLCILRMSCFGVHLLAYDWKQYRPCANSEYDWNVNLTWGAVEEEKAVKEFAVKVENGIQRVGICHYLYMAFVTPNLVCNPDINS